MYYMSLGVYLKQTKSDFKIAGKEKSYFSFY